MKALFLIGLLFSSLVRAEGDDLDQERIVSEEVPQAIQINGGTANINGLQTLLPEGIFLNRLAAIKLNEAIATKYAEAASLAEENKQLKIKTEEQLQNSVSFTTFLAAVSACLALGFSAALLIK